MRIRQDVLAGVLGFATLVAADLGHFARAAESNVPRFLVDPYWPKPLPNRWVTGSVGGICVDKQDHIFGVNRADLTAMEQKVGKQPAPVVIEYDADGDMVNAWGDPKLMPKSDPWLFRRQGKQHLDWRQQRRRRAKVDARWKDDVAADRPQGRLRQFR